MSVCVCLVHMRRVQRSTSCVSVHSSIYIKLENLWEYKSGRGPFRCPEMKFGLYLQGFSSYQSEDGVDGKSDDIRYG